MRQQASIPSSATVAVQRYRVKRVWSCVVQTKVQTSLELGPTPPRIRNNQCQTGQT